MKVMLLADYCSNINDYEYKKGQVIKVSELKEFKDSYAVYHYDGLDWVPKKMVKVVHND